MTPGEKADILEQAADAIDSVGWTTGDWYNYEGNKLMGMCAEGAICYALSGVDLEPGDLGGVRESVFNLLCEEGKKYTPTGTSLFHFNDALASESSEVSDFFRHWAKDLRNANK